ncbi:cation:proton antiporter domain-containing protein [Amycolatopsis sp. RTGN1]|uniref:cation:proton antiporter domain-containing protein n=1 Tax=Amycolatopsis ponsaeliensis TaxID=2992142 RepID=UPI0025514C98|nr:cation:proton antiporter [Amycolatopsis sp. RTGN1]
MTATRTGRVSGTRTVVIYLSLVVLPAAAATALLIAVGGGKGRAMSIAATVHPYARLFLAIALIVVVCKAVGTLVAKVGQPAVVGEIAAGILLGPTLLSSVSPAARQWLIPDPTLAQLQVLAQIGVVLFVFLAGLELDVARLRGRGRLALVVSHVSIAAPFLLGVLLAIAAFARFSPPGLGFLPFALFLGVALSITALPVLARILLDLGMYHQQIGALVMTCALVDDVTAWILLALVVAVATASSVLGVLVTIVLTAAFAGVLWALRPTLGRLLGADGAPGERGALHLVLVGVLVAATCTEWIGVHAIFGAFLFGLALPGESVVAKRVTSMIGGVTKTLLLPLFFAISGLSTDLRLLGIDGSLWGWCVLVVAVAVLGKFGGAVLSARAMGAPARTAGQIGALMNCRGLTELVVLDVGRQLGILSPALFAILVLMTLVTTAMAVPLVKLFRRGEQRDALDIHLGQPGC